MGLGALGFGLLAGVLSVLSPCVLPLLPLVLGGAVAEHRFGPAALATGLIVAFVAMGLLVAVLGFSIGLDEDRSRGVAAVLLAAFGLVLMSEALHRRLALAAAPVGDAGNRLLARLTPSGLAGQFLLGLILGVAWTPCVGPTLGAASLLAANGQNLGTVGLIMAAFALGAALPLLAIGLGSRRLLARWRGPLRRTGRAGRVLLGGAMLALAMLMLSGQERALETVLVDASPAWLIDVTTRY